MHVFGEVGFAHHEEEAEKRGLAFAEYDGSLAKDDEVGLFGGGGDALGLFFRIEGEDAGEGTAGLEVGGGGFAVVVDVAADFETAGDFLGMVAFDAGAEREVGRAAEDEVEFFLGLEGSGFAEVAFADVEAIIEAVSADGFFCQCDAFFPGFDGDDAGTGETPGRDHGDGADPAPPRSRMLRAMGHQLVPYHAVRMSSVG